MFCVGAVDACKALPEIVKVFYYGVNKNEF